MLYAFESMQSSIASLHSFFYYTDIPVDERKYTYENSCLSLKVWTFDISLNHRFGGGIETKMAPAAAAASTPPDFP